MNSTTKNLETEILSAIAAAPDETSLEQLRIASLGKKGSISERMKMLGSLEQDERRTLGAELNELKSKVASAIAERKQALSRDALAIRLKSGSIDVTLPVRPEMRGTIHPLSHVWEEVVQIWGDLGFTVAEGPHIEDDFHNFGALNMPPEHPARQEHDTFYFNEKPDGSRMLLRTHTSPVQIRTMLSSKPPIRIIAPGRTFRCDSDQTHTPMFHQIEGLVVDRDITFADLAGTIDAFTKAYFGRDFTSRLRPSYFPFTEPSAEFDIQRPDGTWLELGGCGMVHPNVLRNCGLDPDEWQGFAFGFGIDRLAAARHGVDDLRDLFTNDIRFLTQF